MIGTDRKMLVRCRRIQRKLVKWAEGVYPVGIINECGIIIGLVVSTTGYFSPLTNLIAYELEV